MDEEYISKKEEESLENSEESVSEEQQDIRVKDINTPEQKEPAKDSAAQVTSIASKVPVSHTHGAVKHSHSEGHKTHEHKESKHTSHTEHHTVHYGHKRGLLGNLKHIYEFHYKKLLILTLLMVFLSIAQVGYQIYSTSYYVGEEFHFGDFMKKGVSLKGGLSITVNNEELDVSRLEISLLESQLASKFPKADISVREQTDLGQRISISIDAALESENDIDEFKKTLTGLMPGLQKDLIDKNTVAIGSTLGESFFKQTFKAMLVAFVLMAIVVFIYFRQPIPSSAVLLAAFSDIITTLAIVNLMGMRISTAGIAAFLMLIGYSVDTDILLSSRVLRTKEGTILDRVYSAMKTGTMMLITTGAAVLVAIIFSQSADLTQIMTIILIGLCVDMPYTWIQNAGILRWYLEKHPLKN
ncbi:protein translocase subunit SecF [Candidatus Woesearchaeota archaeon]|nr:protein translocase subunit SecF [Candidatus Woesearchaeota archaeon]